MSGDLEPSIVLFNPSFEELLNSCLPACLFEAELKLKLFIINILMDSVRTHAHTYKRSRVFHMLHHPCLPLHDQ